jgi:hypothetical protein
MIMKEMEKNQNNNTKTRWWGFYELFY